jgi:hypothetical protein
LVGGRGLLFFIDESGTDHDKAPYEVLAAVAIKEHDLWNLVQAVTEAEVKFFGGRLSELGVELKGNKLLKRKTFRQAGKLPAMPIDERTPLARSFLIESSKTGQATIREFTAYAQSKIEFVKAVYDICASFGVKVFASIVDINAPLPDAAILRKDYAYLFERFYYFLESSHPDEHGLIVFDELDKAQSKIILKQMRHYFLETYKGKTRSSRIIPEPFFVHSDLTTAIQVADITAYCINWGFRIDNKMTKQCREEIREFADRIFELSYKGQHIDERDGKEYPTYGITFIDDLRPSGGKK